MDYEDSADELLLDEEGGEADARHNIEASDSPPALTRKYMYLILMVYDADSQLYIAWPGVEADNLQCCITM